MGQEPPSFVSSFSPHVLDLPTPENAIFNVGKEPETLGFLAAVSQRPPNIFPPGQALPPGIPSACKMAMVCSLLPENTGTLLIRTGHVFS